MDKSRREVLKKLEERLDYRFRDVDLLVTALTHRSYVNENRQPGVSDNERLEFLGDSVLGLCVSDLLIKKYVDGSEGDLTKMRSVLVGEKNLAQLARGLQIGNCLLIGRGEENAGSRARDSFLANAFEAVVAAVYLDSGYENVRAVVRKLIEPFLEKETLPSDYFDYKTLLQEFCQRKFKTIPMYLLADTSGPEHAKVFEVKVVIVDKLTAIGTGTSKKEAEKQAAQKAWKILQDDESQL
ncbi:MAG TPA: ribonuclease III [Smithella sp.]|jgi:ribonuclease III|nr:ribonuclease III [Smithella sp.]NMC97116.1 ribonuclease III [Deltaproteobacteria bacterium]HOO34522.1 ribonuclease III [Smithella sp.]HPR14966.1 ribonuclease III [Smithella sp.]HPV51186.1 ribonuclease III [Smithella sp.]